MSDTERLVFQGRLLNKQNERTSIGLRIKGLISSARMLLDPFADIADLQADEAARQCVDLAGLRIRYNELGHEIEAIRRALGVKD